MFNDVNCHMAAERTGNQDWCEYIDRSKQNNRERVLSITAWLIRQDVDIISSLTLSIANLQVAGSNGS